MNKNTIIAVVVAVLVVLVGAGVYMNKKNDTKPVVVDTTTDTQEVKGEVTAVYEGNHTMEYSFEIPEGATSTKKNATGTMVHVTNASSSLLAAFYFSYEGGRGYTANDYVNEVIAKKVAVVNTMGTTTLGTLSGVEVSSATTVWKIAPAKDGEFLVVVEYPKAFEKERDAIVASFEAK